MDKVANIVTKEEVLQITQKLDWDKLMIVLVAHTCKRLIYRYGIEKPPADLKLQAEELISDIQNKIMVEGVRRWNRDSYDTFAEFFISVIDSELYHLYKKKKDDDVEPEPDKPLPPDSETSPEQQKVADELKAQAIAFLEEEGADDDELMLFECMADGICKPKAVREELGIDTDTYKKIWKKLDRKLKKLRSKLYPNG